MIDRLILWYLKRTNKCFIQHGKYGWRISISFYKDMSNTNLEILNKETLDKYGINK